MSSIPVPVPDEPTHDSSRRQDEADALAWPVFNTTRSRSAAIGR